MARDWRARFLAEMFPDDPLAAQAYESLLAAVRAEARREALAEAAGLCAEMARQCAKQAAGADTDVCVGYGDAEMAARLHARADALRNAERAIRALAAKGGAK